MHRSYQSYWNRFSQPDLYDGSYDFTDPQSLNRYANVQSDPVNFVDPTGPGGPGDHDNVRLMPCVILDRVDTCHGLHIIPGAFLITQYYHRVRDGGIFSWALTPLLQQPGVARLSPGAGVPQKTPAEKQQDYKNCLKQVSDMFDTAHHAIPNVFHNSLPSLKAVGASY